MEKKMTKESKRNLALLAAAVLVMALSVWGPEALAAYMDRGVLNQIKISETEAEGEGYRYQLSSKEKLFILSQCLNAQNLPESDQSALTKEIRPEYQELTGSYAFVRNHKGPVGKEITENEIYGVCSRELLVLKELDILPTEIREVEENFYDASLYSAIDVLEPRNNVAVWKVSLSGGKKNAGKTNRLMDAYIDADSGKLYEFYVRTPLSWEEIDADKLIEAWSGYLGLAKPKEYETENPLLETTPYFRKYVFEGAGEEKTIVTVGFYEGINELFLKISK